MSVLSFNPAAVVTVTIPADTFRDEATEHAAQATAAASRAGDYLTSARESAALLPDEWRTEFGISAAEAVALVESHEEATRRNAHGARAAAEDAEDAETAGAAAVAADLARAYHHAGEFESRNAFRLALILGTAAAHHTATA